MIQYLLKKNPEERYSTDEALNCPWMAMREECLPIVDLSGPRDARKLQKNQQTVSASPGIVASLPSLCRSMDDWLSQQQDMNSDTSVLEAVSTVDTETCEDPFEGLYQWLIDQNALAPPTKVSIW